MIKILLWITALFLMFVGLVMLPEFEKDDVIRRRECLDSVRGEFGNNLFKDTPEETQANMNRYNSEIDRCDFSAI